MARPRKPVGQLGETVSANVPPAMAAEIDAICKATDRNRSNVIKLLLKKGLRAYREDGRLEDTDPSKSTPKLKMAR